MKKGKAFSSLTSTDGPAIIQIDILLHTSTQHDMGKRDWSALTMF